MVEIHFVIVYTEIATKLNMQQHEKACAAKSAKTRIQHTCTSFRVVYAVLWQKRSRVFRRSSGCAFLFAQKNKKNKGGRKL